MPRRKKLAQYDTPGPAPAQAATFDGSTFAGTHSTCSRCGGRSPAGVSLCFGCQGELTKAGAGYAAKEAARKARVRERKKTLGW